MHPKQAMELLDLADDQWLSLSDLVRALERSLDQPTNMVQRMFSVFS